MLLPIALTGQLRGDQGTHAVPKESTGQIQIRLQGTDQLFDQEGEPGERRLPEALFAPRQLDRSHLSLRWQCVCPATKQGGAPSCMR